MCIHGQFWFLFSKRSLSPISCWNRMPNTKMPRDFLVWFPHWGVDKLAQWLTNWEEANRTLCLAGSGIFTSQLAKPWQHRDLTWRSSSKSLEETLSPTVPPKANLLQWPPQLTKFPQKAWAWIAEDLAKLKSNVLITPWQLLSLSITTWETEGHAGPSGSCL
jgi:hypothetical protein